MLFSVIIPCFNSENHISTCLKYLLAQINSDDDIEVLLVDDGSNDNTLSIISEYKEKYPYYIKIIKNEKNRGVSYSRNVGIYNSIGKFILFLDSDDQYKDGLFIELRNIIKKSSDIDIVSFSFLREGGKDKSETIYSFKEFNKKIFYNIDFFKLFCIKKINQHICSAAFRRELIISNNIFFDLGTYIGEDVEFQIKSI
ncbi:glycosyltransferase family 2 protein, partial [Proteus mirabilis]